MIFTRSELHARVDAYRQTAEDFLSTFLRQAQRTGNSLRGSTATLSTQDSRWTLVSTSLTAVVAGAIGWMAMGTMPPSTPRIHTSSHGFMPYQLFLQLAREHKGEALASFAPTSVFDELRARSTTDDGNPLDGALAEENATGGTKPGIETHTITLDSGDTLMGALGDAGIPLIDSQRVIAALAKVFDPRGVHAGQSFDLTFETKTVTPPVEHRPAPPPQGITIIMPNDGVSYADNDTPSTANVTVQPAPVVTTGRLLSVAFSPSVQDDIAVTRTAEGNFTATDAHKTLHAQAHRAGATIDSSLYLSAMQAGIPAEIVVDMIHMFSYEVDFQRDLHPGNSFQVFYDTYYTPDGQPAKQGNVRFATIKLGDRTISLYRYQPDANEPADYFDAHGQSAKSMLMKTPVDGARISSGFGMRFHPVLGYTRMHKGIDFAVPSGTPVMAAGSGVVQKDGWAGGYGNFLLLNHENGYSTAYGHLSRFAPGIRPGVHVRQGQVVAYSGATGMATGPHLHYEIRVNEIQVNPLTVKVATGRHLSGPELRNFLADRLGVDEQLAAMPLETKLADAASDLRAAKQ